LFETKRDLPLNLAENIIMEASMKKLFDNEFFHAGNCAENVTISSCATSEITFVSF